MKVKTSKGTVEQLVLLLERFDASTEQFLDALPTPEKYTILAMALVVKGDYDDFEDAYYELTHSVNAQGLTKHFLDSRYLYCLLQDALRFKWSDFECAWTDEGEDEEEEELN